MQQGNVGGGDKGSGRRSHARDKKQVSVCDLSSDAFKKNWLILKELHDREVLRLQRKLTSLRKERLADRRRAGSKAKIEELMEQQKILNITIHDLRNKLSSKICDCCSVNEMYRKTLQKEFYHIQQKNMKFIASLLAERSKLREENEQLSARLKLKEQQLSARLKLKEQHLHPSSSDSDDDFIPGTQNSGLVFSVRKPAPRSQMHLPVRLVKQSNTEEMRSGGKKEQQRSPTFPGPLYGEGISEVPETPLESSSNSSKPATVSSANRKSSVSFPLTSKPGAQSRYGFQGDFSLPEDRLGNTQKELIFTQKTSTQKRRAQMYFSWSPSSISAREKRPTPLVSETSEEAMPGHTSSFAPFTQRKEKRPLNVLPFDCTSSGKRRSVTGVAHCKTGFSVRDSCGQTPFNEELTVRKNTTESTGAAHGADKPQGETQSFILGSAIKGKARVQSERRK
ncbi:hypothetical protein E2I00_012464 [Balaenoptera physalus]|uniref:DNA endonuclease Ctp1 N-terminal domain-containing protein n=1 Tax=Balaenoptera physalus TaxID=9770 RepID=A0A6A1Q1H4_BALPH|nr:hypothetical protein E2I00_012464 [Balaenoptera physalus]